VTLFKDRAQTLLLLFLTAGIVFGPARAQAAASGTIEGRVVRAPSDKPLPHVKVTLLGANPDGSDPIRRTAVTDGKGRYAFGHVATSNVRIYALNARYEGGLFAGGAIQVPSDTSAKPLIKTQLRVWNTTTDPSAISITRDDLFVQQNHDGTGVIESINVQNNTNAAYIGRGGKRSGNGKGAAPSLGFALPTGASRQGIAIVQSDLDLPQLLPTDFGVAATAAIPPGSTRITYSYRVQGLVGATDISRTTLYPTAEVSIFAASPLAIQSNRLTNNGDVSINKIKYQRWSSRSPLAPGDELQALAVARAGLAPGLIIGVVVGVVLFMIGGLLYRLRRGRTHAVSHGTSQPATRKDVLLAIAKLDRKHEAGEVAEDEWKEERARLKTQAEKLP
jgi:hypothetical protein